MSSKVKNFWTKPDNIPLSAKEVSFGYTQDGKEAEYKASIKNNDLAAFHKFIYALLASKDKGLLPWVIIKGDLKSKVEIINPKDDAIQTELPLKVAGNYIKRNRNERT